MATATTRPRAPKSLSDDQLNDLLGLMKKADSVELKATVPDSERLSAIAALDLDPLDGEIRQVWFLDTAALDLDRHGVVVRVRRIQGKTHDSVVKLRPVAPEHLDDDLRRTPGFGVEVDAMPGGYVCSASLKGELGPTHVLDAVAGKRPVRKLLSRGQRRFYATHAPEGLGLDDLAFLGPITLVKLRFTPRELGRKMVAELWFYPNGSRLLELSTKCRPNEAFQVATETRAFLAGRGVDISGTQRTKTRTALDYFSKELLGRG